MPIYDFKCADCAREFEVLVRRQDDIVLCEQCKGQNVARMIPRGTSFVLQGGGWYQDGYAARSNVK